MPKTYKKVIYNPKMFLDPAVYYYYISPNAFDPCFYFQTPVGPLRLSSKILVEFKNLGIIFGEDFTYKDLEEYL